MSNGLRGGDHDKGRGLLGLARLKVQSATPKMRSPSPNGLATPRSQTVSRKVASSSVSVVLNIINILHN